MSVEEKVKDITINVLKVAPEEISENSNFIDDLGADSLDTVDLIMALEDKFNIKISDEDAQQILDVKTAVKYISEKIKDPQ